MRRYLLRGVGLVVGVAAVVGSLGVPAVAAPVADGVGGGVLSSGVGVSANDDGTPVWFPPNEEQRFDPDEELDASCDDWWEGPKHFGEYSYYDDVTGVQRTVVHRFTVNCAPDPIRIEVEHWTDEAHTEYEVRHVCMEPGTVHYRGYSDDDPATSGVGTYKGVTWNASCGNTEPSQPWPWPTPPENSPMVTVRGKVTASINLGAPGAEMSGARYKLMYYGYDGDRKEGEKAWHEVLASVDELGAPTGDAVTGYLGDWATGNPGEYELTFPYPSEISLSNGTKWTGCDRPDDPVEYLGSYACAPGDLELRIYPVNANGSVKVESGKGAGGVVVAEGVPLGHFFDRDSTVFKSERPYSMAYAAAQTTDRFFETDGRKREHNITIRLTNDGTNGWSSSKGQHTVYIDRLLSGTTMVEHSVSHTYLYEIYGGNYNGRAPKCISGSPFVYTTDAECAWSEGLAYFSAIAGEAMQMNRTPRYFVPELGKTIDMEADCRNEWGVECEDGATVAGRIVSSFVDLVDTTAITERKNGFTDRTHYPVYNGDILRLVAYLKPSTFSEFWEGWQRFGPEGRDPVKDRVTLFLNTLGDFRLVDDDSAYFNAGKWETVMCGPCRGGSMALSVSGEPAEARWLLNRSLPDSGSYDVFVRLPAGTDYFDPNVQYIITNGEKKLSAIIDQSAVVDGWLQLNEKALRLDSTSPIVLTASSGADSPAKSLVVDAVVVAPHESGWPTGVK